MIKRNVILFYVIFVLVIITGCAATNVSRTATFNVNKKEYATYVKAEDGPFGTKIHLYINDNQIAEGTLSVLTPQTVFSGEYKGIKFDAECAASKSGGINMVQRCSIYAKGKKVAEVQY